MAPANKGASKTALELARRLAGLAEEKKAAQLALLDVSALTDYTEIVLLATAGNERHARALADHLRETLRPEKIRPLGMEGYDGGRWILLDFGEVVVHLMVEATRLYYDLDGLWTEARRIPLDAGA